MRHLRRFAVLLALPVLMAAGPTPVVLAERPGTDLDKAARALIAADLAEARRAGEIPLLLVGSAKLGAGPHDRPALFVQAQSPRECGSAGCSTSVWLWRNGAWKRILDGVGGTISVAPTRTRGMADLVTDATKYVWTGTEYRDSRPAPPAAVVPRTPVPGAARP
jgi:hypothetical protein